MEENMSNLTYSCVSNEAISVSSINYGNGNDNLTPLPSVRSQLPSPKKKRNQPGHPEANAEVIALSPKTLVATNRFICEVCKKGFQRDQNLQLHRRGHNLPWKLKKKQSAAGTDKDDDDVVIRRKKVYVCPETKCVHHNPSRALGDLTGIKKHFSRKHCEKKWKCERCSKKYAVKSDWKAHSKVCGTRNYTCHCGTLFSRRDSFITHRAFCDPVGVQQDYTRNSIPVLQSPNNYNSIIHLHQTQTQIQIQMQMQPKFKSCISDKFQLPTKKEHQNLSPKSEIPPWLSPSSPIGPFTSGPPAPSVDYPNPNPNPTSTAVPTDLLPPTLSQAGEFTGAHHGLPSRDDEVIVDDGTMSGEGRVTGCEISREEQLCSPFVVQGFLEGQGFEESLRLDAAIDDEFSSRSYSGTTTRDFMGLGETDLFSFGIDFINNHIN